MSTRFEPRGISSGNGLSVRNLMCRHPELRTSSNYFARPFAFAVRAIPPETHHTRL